MPAKTKSTKPRAGNSKPRTVRGDQARVLPNVQLGTDARLGEFVIVGEPPRGKRPGELETRIGARAVIRSHTVIYSGNMIGDDFETGHGVLVREENEIGDHVSIGSHAVVEHHVKIGNHVRLHSNVFVPEYCVLEDGCWLGPSAVLTNARYPLSPNAKRNLRGVTVQRGAKIGANATVLPGITIGANALVGAGAVVTRDVPADAVVAGNPARMIGQVEDIEAYKKAESSRQ